jgi:MFS family permease
MVVALILLGQAVDAKLLTAGGVLFGLATAGTKPVIMALAMDRSRPDRRGAAMATYSMAFQLGQGSGSLLIGVLIETIGYDAMYLAATVPALVTLLVVRGWVGTEANGARGLPERS